MHWNSGQCSSAQYWPWMVFDHWVLYWIVPVLQGLLSRYKDRLVQTTREERTHVFQDYATLLSTVLTNLSQSTTRGDNSQPASISAEEVVPTLSFLMDNAFLFTPSGLWPIVVSVMELVKTTVHVAPSVSSRWPWYLFCIGQFSKAGLLEWMRFVIFRARSCERLQRTSGPISE